MQYFEKGHLSCRESKKNFFFFMGDESPNAHESKSMIGLVPSAKQPTLQSSKVQNCQHWGQLLGGSLSTFLIALGEILSIFIYIFGFHWKILPILMFGLHSGLSYFCQKCRNSRDGACVHCFLPTTENFNQPCLSHVNDRCEKCWDQNPMQFL